MEKYIDLTTYGVEHDINSYLANGWNIKNSGLTFVVMEKENEAYSIMAAEFVKAIKTISEKTKNLDNLELYLTYHFPEWLEKFANTPGGIVSELKAFGEMEV